MQKTNGVKDLLSSRTLKLLNNNEIKPWISGISIPKVFKPQYMFLKYLDVIKKISMGNLFKAIIGDS